MKIKLFQIQNFRKLTLANIEMAEQTTIFVGPNNSGKTSAMYALIKFLTYKSISFTINDISLNNWENIELLGNKWKTNDFSKDTDLQVFKKHFPSLDVWIDVGSDELNYVDKLFPTLSFEKGLIGIRLILEPKNLEELFHDFFERWSSSQTIMNNSKATNANIKFTLWPKSFYDYLTQKISLFEVKKYKLNPSLLYDANGKINTPQDFRVNNVEISNDQFEKIIKVDSVGAQRGFSDSETNSLNGELNTFEKGSLSVQLKEYYQKHINPEDMPDVSDVIALDAMEIAYRQYEKKLQEGFKSTIKEVEELGYPGFSNPEIEVITSMDTSQLLSHESSVKFKTGADTNLPKLPEKYNGLGYQNLISIIFKLIRFRDDWMQVGKVGKKKEKEKDNFVSPIHLVLLEEPEAHLHAQAQQVFIRKAYQVLRNHENLKDKKTLVTQVIISTHSNHIAHEVDFSTLRYFRRVVGDFPSPISEVLNLSMVFDSQGETSKFAARYLKSTHCDIFFCDALILVEGTAEMLLLPHFILNNYAKINQSYISILEISGRYAERLRPLIDFLKVKTLIITDIDSCEPSGHHSKTPVERSKKQITTNGTLINWLPQINTIDELLDLRQEKKINDSNLVMVTYQTPISIGINGIPTELLPRTFEDSLILTNYSAFLTNTSAGDYLPRVKEILNRAKKPSELSGQLFNEINSGSYKKAEFILELLFDADPKTLNTPKYIADGLLWLSNTLEQSAISIS